MKKYLCMALIFTCSATAYAESEKDMVNKALQGDYQVQRNLAHYYMDGRSEPDYIPQSPIHACAWRKIIILTSADKIDAGDFGNESVDCKKVHPTDNEKVWNVVFAALKAMPN
ncbi:hypothetical protein [Yersinia rohdei]|uniref:hypothetical protein n=1 Tax=Yersinia rohdei TaxID=29485 RepID=UPI0011A5AB0A|nr:hypothetical protein [Yersinia rohdei]